MFWVCVSQVLGGVTQKERWHFKAYTNPRVGLENTFSAKSTATPNTVHKVKMGKNDTICNQN